MRSTTLNRLDLPLADEIDALEGEIQRLTPTIDALYVPDIDESLDEVGAKQRFWSSFRALGDVVRPAAAVLADATQASTRYARLTSQLRERRRSCDRLTLRPRE